MRGLFQENILKIGIMFFIYKLTDEYFIFYFKTPASLASAYLFTVGIF
jgi:hypothetical protein